MLILLHFPQEKFEVKAWYRAVKQFHLFPLSLKLGNEDMIFAYFIALFVSLENKISGHLGRFCSTVKVVFNPMGATVNILDKPCIARKDHRIP